MYIQILQTCFVKTLGIAERTGELDLRSSGPDLTNAPTLRTSWWDIGRLGSDYILVSFQRKLRAILK